MQDTHVSTASHPRRFSFDLFAVWALTVSAAVAAILFVPASTAFPFIYSKVSLAAIGGVVALAAFILARLTRGNIILPPVALLGAFWLVPLGYALSTLFSGTGFRAGTFGTELEPDTFGFMLLLAVFATLVALTFRRSSQYRVFYMVAGAAVGVIAAVQVLFLIAAQVSTKIGATTNLVGSFVDLGMLIGLALSIGLLALRFLTLSTRVRNLLYGFGGLSLVLLALVNSTLIWILVGLVALGLFIEAIMRRKNGATDEDFEGVELLGDDNGSLDMGEAQGLAAPLLTLVFALFFLIGGNTIGSALTNSLGVTYLDVRPSWQSTFAVGSHTYAASPLFGSGPNTFVEDWLKFKDRSLNETIFWNIDFTSGIGLIPTSFITTGIVGALAWLAFLGLFLIVGMRALLFRAPEETFARFTAISSYVGTAFVFALMVFTVPGPIVLLTGFMLAGLFVSSLRYGGTRRELGIIFSKNPRVGFVIVFALTILLLASVIAAYAITERYLASVSYQHAARALAAGDTEGARTASERSLVFSPSDRAYQLRAAAGIADMNAIANDTTLSPSQAQERFQAALSGSVQAALAATQLRPNNYQNWAILGNVYQTVVPLKIEGAYDKAKDAYQKALALNPTNPTIYYILAQLEIAKGDTKAAEEDLTSAINQKRDYTQAILLLSQLEVSLGKADEALQAAEAAAYFAPNDANVLFQVGILRSGTGDQDGAIAALSRAVDVNPQYANARFFLAVAYAGKGSYDLALAQLEAIAAVGPQNAQAVASYIATLKTGKNPFPATRQGALGIPAGSVPDTGKTSTAPAR